jgi:hypothetical protein
MLRLLEDKDAMQAVAACLTRGQAGMLARLCRAGRAYVRAADDKADAGRPDGFAVLATPMWALERTRARVAARWPKATPRNLSRKGRMLVMNSLAAELVRQQELGVARLVFERAAARDGRKLSLFGCHRLEVLDGYAFLEHMEAWFQELRRTTSWSALEQFAVNERCYVHKKASSRVLAILLAGGLRVRGKRYRLADDAARGVGGAEALWHEKYWAW